MRVWVFGKSGIGALVLRQSLTDGPAVVRLAQQFRLEHLDVVEERLAEWSMAVDQDAGSDAVAGAVHGQQQEADVPVLGSITVGAYQAGNPVGVVGAGASDLRAVHQMVNVLFCGAR